MSPDAAHCSDAYDGPKRHIRHAARWVSSPGTIAATAAAQTHAEMAVTNIVGVDVEVDHADPSTSIGSING